MEAGFQGHAVFSQALHDVGALLGNDHKSLEDQYDGEDYQNCDETGMHMNS